jgi:hypothetical protein
MMMPRTKQRLKRSAGTIFGPAGALKVMIAPWRRAAISSDIEAIDRGESRKMMCWFRGLYGDYPRTFHWYLMNLSPDGLVLIEYLLFMERRRIPIREELLSARERMAESDREASWVGTGGMRSEGQPVLVGSNGIISCETPLGVLEFAVKWTDIPVFLHYIDRLRQHHQSSPHAPTA